MTLHIPILRAGRAYESLERVTLTDVASGEPVAEVSQANPGLIARDLAAGAAERQAKLQEIPSSELLPICRRAAELFATGELPVDAEGAVTQGPEAYLGCLAATTGMPRALGRANMEKIRFVLAEMETVLGGLTRGLDLTVLDEGRGSDDAGRTLSFLRQADALGVVLPSNSPGVHSLWLPAFALKVPVVAKPGRQEPWTPLRIGRALVAAGLPEEAFSFYPAGHAGSTEVLLGTGRSLLFGDKSTVGSWASDPRVELHGPGWSKVILGEDRLPHWREHLDLIAESVAANGGRSCVNASGVRVPGRGREIAEALVERLAAIEPLPLDHPEAQIAAWGDAELARRVSAWIDGQLSIPGAEDVTASFRPRRLVEVHGLTFLLPTVVFCSDPEHPLTRAELLFPFVSVVEVPEDELLGGLGPTLVGTVLSDDPELHRRALACRAIERLNLGPVPTCRVSWDQPHEGNLFEHLYHRRAFQSAA